MTYRRRMKRRLETSAGTRHDWDVVPRTGRFPSPGWVELHAPVAMAEGWVCRWWRETVIGAPVRLGVEALPLDPARLPWYESAGPAVLVLEAPGTVVFADGPSPHIQVLSFGRKLTGQLESLDAARRVQVKDATLKLAQSAWRMGPTPDLGGVIVGASNVAGLGT